MITDELWTQALQVIGIIWIDLVLSGDNAVVIALACRGLPERHRRIGIILGTATAVVLRLIFALVVSHLLDVPFLKIAGALLLLWIAVKLLDDSHGDEEVPETDRLWQAIGTIAMADAVMSLDNVFAIVAIAGESIYLLIFGLTVSIPLIVAGASIVLKLLEHFPILTWAGAGLLGWVAGHMLVTDPWMHDRLAERGLEAYEIGASIIGAILVLAMGYGLKRWRAAGASRAREIEATRP